MKAFFVLFALAVAFALGVLMTTIVWHSRANASIMCGISFGAFVFAFLCITFKGLKD